MYLIVHLLIITHYLWKIKNHYFWPLSRFAKQLYIYNNFIHFCWFVQCIQVDFVAIKVYCIWARRWVFQFKICRTNQLQFSAVGQPAIKKKKLQIFLVFVCRVNCQFLLTLMICHLNCIPKQRKSVSRLCSAYYSLRCFTLNNTHITNTQIICIHSYIHKWINYITKKLMNYLSMMMCLPPRQQNVSVTLKCQLHAIANSILFK